MNRKLIASISSNNSTNSTSNTSSNSNAVITTSSNSEEKGKEKEKEEKKDGISIELVDLVRDDHVQRKNLLFTVSIIVHTVYEYCTVYSICHLLFYVLYGMFLVYNMF